MNFSKIKERTWIFNEHGGKNYDEVILNSDGIVWQSWNGAPQYDYEVERKYFQTLDDFIFHRTRHKPLHGPIKKELIKEMLIYIAQHAQEENLLRDYWEIDSNFIRVESDSIVAGTQRGSFPGGDIATSWPFKGFNLKKAIEVLSNFDVKIIHEVALTIELLRAIRNSKS